MLSSTIGPDFNDPQPLHNTFRDGKPCDEWVPNPTPSPLPKAAAEKAAGKAATKKRLAAEDIEARQNVQHLLTSLGPVYKRPGRHVPPTGNWTSSTPTQFLTLDCARGEFGQARNESEPRLLVSPLRAAKSRKDLKAEGFNLSQFEAAQAAAVGWRGIRSWKTSAVPTASPIEQPKSFSDGPAVDSALVRAATIRDYKGRSQKLTDDQINDAYEKYVTSPETERGNLEVSLYLFAQKYSSACENELWQVECDMTADDFIASFTFDLIDRFRKGQYRTHVRKFHHWINKKWGLYFAGEKTKLAKERNLTVRVNEGEFRDKDEAEENRSRGEMYWTEIAREVNDREKENWNSAERQVGRILNNLDRPDTFWGALTESARTMLRAMANGATQKEAAKIAGISEDHGGRLFRDLKKSARVNPEIREKLSFFKLSDSQLEAQRLAGPAQ